MSTSDQMEEVDLSQFDADFEAAEEPAAYDGKIPEGKYVARIERAYFRKAKSSGAPMLSWELQIVGPEQAGSLLGRKLFRNNMLAKMEWVKKDLRTCGIQIARISELDLNDLIGLELDVQVKHNGDNQNVYLNGLVGGGAGATTTGAGGGATFKKDGVIPF